MSDDTARVLSHQTNVAVVQLPSRNFPGSVIQGDTLHSHVRRLKDALAAFEAGDLEEARDSLNDALEAMQDRLEWYEHVLDEHGIELPYPN